MSVDNARSFVEKMKQDQSFRKRAVATTGPEDLLLFLQQENLPFDQRELVEAMAECMERLNSKESVVASSCTGIERSEEMENRIKLIAPCGLDCGICGLYMCRDDKQLMDSLISQGISKEALPCNGCREVEGKCPVIHGKCATFECADKNRVSFCSECNDFPCMKLAPAADKAEILPHNTKLYKLCVTHRLGVEVLIERALEIKQSYFRGKIEIGEGPKLESED